MEEVILKYYPLILILTIFFVLALIGYIRKNVFHKELFKEDKINFNELKTNLEELEVKEDKSLKELLKGEKDLSNLNR